MTKINHQDYLNEKNKNFAHLLNNTKKYLFSLTLIILSLPTIFNFLKSQPLFKGGESYYHLSSTGFYQTPWSWLIKILPEQILFVIPILLALLSIYLFIIISKNFGLSRKLYFLFLLFTILTPAFILTFSTISSNSLFITLLLLGIYLITQENQILKKISLIPFLAASFFDIYSTLITIIAQTLIFHKNRKEILPKIILGSTFLSLIINIVFLNQHLVLGPFGKQQILIDLISDLGGISGASFFIILLSLIGVFVTWKRKKLIGGYFFLPLIVPLYFYNTQTTFTNSLLIVFFATVAFIKIFEWKWDLDSLKKFTLLVLLLGILFSTISFLDRIDEKSPSPEDQEILQWIKENTNGETIIISAPENSYYIKSIANRQAFHYPHLGGNKLELNKQALNAIYVKELFPILDNHNVGMIFISKQMKENLDPDQGLLFLLRNERFKLVHSSGNSEVWLYKKE